MTLRVGAADKALAERLAVPFDPDAEFVLEYRQGRLQLRDLRDGAPSPLFVDFASHEIDRRRTAGRQLPVARAVGIKPDFTPSILDATIGLGRDAYTLHALGCAVTGVERSPVIASLLEDGLQRAGADLPLLVGDSREVMARLKPDERPQVVYLDPMFPERRKSAGVKKEMQYMQAILGDDDLLPLFEAALSCATRRVVVKRPVNAPYVVESPKPNHTFAGKTVRFDVYLTTR